MNKIFIIYDHFFDAFGENITIGGIQTYIKCLCEVSLKVGCHPIVVQYADIDYYKKYNRTEIYGIKDDKSGKRRIQAVRKCEELGDVNNDILIFASYIFNTKTMFKKTISIQHGISWDIPIYSRGIFSIPQLLRRFISIYGVISKINRTRVVVCVDYNFINWYRTIIRCFKNNFYIIPNFSRIPESKRDNNNTSKKIIKILFARRLWFYRGTRLFADAIEVLSNDNDNLFFTIAGEGPDEQYLKDKLGSYKNVEFTSYESDKSLEIHSQFDIAVVPTLGSEGTSLSLLEAMATGCAVIASNVGGMTNIIIDGFNGQLINPDVDSLCSAIRKLAYDDDYRQMISKNAVSTIESGFSYEKWEKSWIRIINLLNEDK